MLTNKTLLEALKKINDPEIHKSIVELNMVRNIKIDGTSIQLEVVLTIQGCPLKAQIKREIEEALKEIGATQVELTFGSMTAAEATTETGMPKILKPDSGVRFIAITSGKGGVGKSTVTINLAVALARQGKRVGIIDADIYGFSIPTMMKIDEKPTMIDQTAIPVVSHGVKVMSMGFYAKDNQPVMQMDSQLFSEYTLE